MRTKTHPWIRPTKEFDVTNDPRPENAASIDIQFFVEKKTGKKWLAKCSINSIINDDDFNYLKKQEQQGFHQFSRYFEEILEKLASELYSMIGVITPETILSYQQASKQGKQRIIKFSQKPPTNVLYLFSKFVENFKLLDKDFEKNYHKMKLLNPKIASFVKGSDGVKDIPLRGLGTMLAAANFLYDPDCIGNSGSNAGYIICKDSVGEEYAQLVKIDTGYALSFYRNRFEKRDNLLERKITISPSGTYIPFSELNEHDQDEFCKAAVRILTTPQVEFEKVIHPAYTGDIFLPEKEKEIFLIQLTARKNIFLGVFSHDAGSVIKNEIEKAEASLALLLESENQKPLDIEGSSESIMKRQKKQVEFANALYAQLAKHESKEVLSVLDGTCKTFQLPKENNKFVGRKDILQNLSKQLQEKRTGVIKQTVRGLGGIGKTQLALKYAHDSKSKYKFIIWLRSEGNLEAQFQQIASAWLNMENVKLKDAIASVYAHIHNKSSLLVFDNAENVENIGDYLPSEGHQGNPHVLITSRSRQWGDFPSLSLDGFSIDEAKEFMKREMNAKTFASIQEEEFNTLHKLLAGLPLAYSQAVSYINVTGHDVGKFIEEFRLNQSSMWSNHLNNNDPHPKTIDTVVIISLARAKMTHQSAEILLVICSYLDPDRIQPSLLSDITGFNKEQVEQGVKALESVSLLSNDNGYISIHRLVQEMVRYRRRGLVNQNLRERLMKALELRLDFDSTKIQTAKSASEYVQHVMAFSSAKENLSLSKEDTLKFVDLLEKAGNIQKFFGYYSMAHDIFKECLEMRQKFQSDIPSLIAKSHDNLGTALRNLGFYQEALKFCLKAVELRKEILGENHPDTASSLNNVGTVYRDLGQYQKALDYCLESMKIRESILEEKHPAVASSHSNVGLTYSELGNYEKALTHCTKSLTLTREIFGEKNPETATAYNNVAMAYKDLGDFQGALEYSIKALELNEQIFGENHPQTAISYSNVGMLNRDLSHYQEALRKFEKSLALNREIFGERNPVTATLYNNVGLTHSNLGNHQEALNYCLKALELRKEVLGESHSDTATSYNNVGGIYQDLGQYQKALDIRLKSLELTIGIHGENHPDTARSYNNVGMNMNNLGHHQQALEYLIKSLEIYKSKYEENHPQIPTSYDNLGTTLRSLGFYQEALKFCLKALELRMKILGENHSDTASSLSNVGTVYRDLGQHEKALEHFEKALIVGKSLYEERHPEIARFYNNVGMARKDLGNLQGAIQYLVKALELRKEILGEGHPDTTTSYNNVGLTHSGLGQHQEALECSLKTLELRKKSYGENHPETAKSYNNVGMAYRSLGNYQKSLEYFEKALELYRSIKGDAHADTASIYDNIGLIMKDLKNHQGALQYLEKALVIRLKLLTKNHPHTIMSFNNVGIAYDDLGEYQNAIKYSSIALQLAKEVFGEKHHITHTFYSNIGNMHGKYGNFQEGLENSLKSLELRKELLEEKKSDGITYSQNFDNYAENLNNYFKIMELKKQSELKKHPNT